MGLPIPCSLHLVLWTAQRSANGTFVLYKGKITSVCYACAVGNNKLELDVETSKEFQGKGLATLVTSIFINKCIKKGMAPV
ncbi:GNAT family N-acetyltransferase [Dethiothermospora halolimnae]|uniref:GNAT family N-acetyltransferase n=1 Tax=Dethiothermospora halolimnae TaxID=3114390 RepID=UPI003CCB8D73